MDRIKHWLGNGAKPTDTVHRFLSDAGLLKPIKKIILIKPNLKRKALERIKAKEELLKEEKRRRSKRSSSS